MSWPTPQEYNEAVQNPALSFDDPELQSGEVERTALGLPRPITGNFASVYRFHCGGRDWAVRCFWRELADMQERYAAVSRHLRQTSLPYTVGFQYLARGIRVQGKWYPILKMEWLEGQLLNEYINAHIHDSAALRRLPDAWAAMMISLERAQVAHGDLQHGNVIVAGNALKLVDYDCMFVPALLGRRSYEIGHQNYQHPARTGSDFGPELDRFSAWAIYLALLAIRADADIWAEYGSEERLLLSKSDLEQPEGSRVPERLRNHGDETVRAAALRVSEYLSIPPGAIPPLAGGMSAARPAERRAALSRRSQVGLSGSSAPQWVLEHMALLPHDESRPALRPDSGLLRACSTLVIAGALFPIPAASLGGLPLAGDAVASFALLVSGASISSFRFHRQPAVAEKNNLLAQRRAQLRQLRRTDRAIRAREEERVRDVTRLGDRLESLRGRLDELRARERQECLEEKERFGTRLRVVDDRLREINRQEDDALRTALGRLRERYVEDALSQASVRTAEIVGMPWTGRVRLWAGGIRTAGDVLVSKDRVVSLVGHLHAAAVSDWSDKVQAAALAGRPQALPREIADPIKQRASRERSHGIKEREELERMRDAVLQRIAERYAGKYRTIEDRTAVARAECEQQCNEHDDALRQLSAHGDRYREALQEIDAELRMYANVTFVRYIMSGVVGQRRGLVFHARLEAAGRACLRLLRPDSSS